MRIGVDGRLIHEPELRGMGRYQQHLVEYLLKVREDIEIVVYHERPAVPGRLTDSPRLKQRRLWMKGSRFYLWEQSRLPLQSALDRLSILHCTANTLPLMQVVPTVLTLHDAIIMMSDEDEGAGFLFYSREILPLAIKRASLIITISNHSKRDIMRTFALPEHKIRVIHQGLDPSVLPVKNPAPVLARLGVQGPYLFALGASGPRKNTSALIEAYAESLHLLGVRKGAPRLVIAGLREDAMRRFGLLARQREVRDRITLLGFVSDSELLALYSGALLFVYPSLYEGFGFPILEAMACGAPVVTSNTSSMPEVGGDAVCYVDPTKTSDICRGLLEVAQDEALQARMREEGMAMAATFTWERTARETYEVYKEAMNL